MKRTRHTPEQIIRKLKTAEQLIAQGKTVADVSRALEVSQPTYHRWRQLYGGMQAEEAKRLTQLEKGNARLKKLLAEAEPVAFRKGVTPRRPFSRPPSTVVSVPDRDHLSAD
jgi:putative transposase